MNATITRIFSVAALFCCWVWAGAAEPPTQTPTTSATVQHSAEPPHGPPPEAYKACEGKMAGSEAELVNPKGEKVAGLCQNDGSGKIVLRPDHPPGGCHEPPPEAYQACVGKIVGNAAQFTGPKGEAIQGTCETEGERLVLRPRHPPTAKEGE